MKGVQPERGCTSGGVYVPCIYSHARWELPWTTQIFVVVFVLRLFSADYLPFVLILCMLSGPRSVSNWGKRRGLGNLKKDIFKGLLNSYTGCTAVINELI